MPFSRSHKNHPQLQLAQPTGRCKVTASPAGPPAEAPAAQGCGHSAPSSRGERTNQRTPGEVSRPGGAARGRRLWPQALPRLLDAAFTQLRPQPLSPRRDSPQGRTALKGHPCSPGGGRSERRGLGKRGPCIGGTWRDKAAGGWKPGRSPLKIKRGVVRMGRWGGPSRGGGRGAGHEAASEPSGRPAPRRALPVRPLSAAGRSRARTMRRFQTWLRSRSRRAGAGAGGEEGKSRLAPGLGLACPPRAEGPRLGGGAAAPGGRGRAPERRAQVGPGGGQGRAARCGVSEGARRVASHPTR